MTPNSLSPAFGVIAYDSAYGSHKCTIPTLAWSIGIGTNGYGGYVAHDGTTAVDAMDLWENLVDLIKVYHLPSTTFNTITLYTKASPTAPSVPVAIIPSSDVGTSVATTQSKAAQSTFNFRTTLFNPFKLVMLDAPVATGFTKTLRASWGAPDLALEGEFSDQAKPWAGRDGAVIASGISKTYTLNEKLRRAYEMA